MEQSRRIDDDKIGRKWTPSFPRHESMVSGNAQKQRRLKIIYTLLCRWRYAWNFGTTISVNLLSIYWAVSELREEYKACHLRTVRSVLSGQSDPLFFAIKFNDDNTYTFDRWSCARRSSTKVPRTCGKVITTKIVWLRFVLMQDSRQRLTSDSTSWQKTLKNSHNLRQEKSSDRKGWIWKNTKIGSVLEVTTSCLLGKYRVEIRPLMGQNFPWLEKVGHELEHGGWQKRAGNFWDAVRRFCVENECGSFGEPIKGFACPLSKTLYLTVKDVGLILSQKIFVYRLPNVKTTEYSSAAWWSTSRRRWCDRILEIRRWSSERFCALSTLVLWSVEEYKGKRRRKQ